MTLRIAAALAATGALLLTTTACGSDSDAYCDHLESVSGSIDLDTADLTDSAQMAEFARAFGGVVDVAPDNAKGDWEELSGFFEQLADGKGLEDFSQDDAASVESAMNNITVDVQETCDMEV